MGSLSTNYKDKPHFHLRIIVLLLLLTVAAGLAIFILFSHRGGSPESQPILAPHNDVKTDNEPAYHPIDLQSTIDDWVAKQPATYSITVYDLQSKTNIGTSLPEREYFAASLYKQFVAYIALVDMQSGDMDPNEVLWGGFTRKECIDKMIRESHSPCGETMMADIGQQTLNSRVADLSMNGTYFNGIRTTARDCALLLQFIAEGRDLSEENIAFIRDAMLTQDAKYKRGLQAGAPDAKWETKVGWNGDENYHDIGIMTLPDGRAFVITILSEGNGSSRPIADFAATIYTSLNQ